jgi:hypothetical protein
MKTSILTVSIIASVLLAVQIHAQHNHGGMSGGGSHDHGSSSGDRSQHSSSTANADRPYSESLGFFQNYFEGVKALSRDDFNAAVASFRLFAVNARNSSCLKAARKDDFIKISTELATANDLSALRKSLDLASRLVIRYLTDNGMEKDGVYFYYCPMTKGNWVSASSNVENPYFGKEMLSCGVRTMAAR